MKYDIIIPSWNQKDFAINCLKSIQRFSDDYRVIFIDNASEEEEFNAVYEVLKTIPHLLVRNTDNAGFIKATNQGLYLSTAPFVIMMNNDTEAVENWLQKLEEPLKNENIVMSGPRTTTKDSWQGVYPPADGWITLGQHAMLAFFCTMFKKSVFDVCGYLDEDFGAGFGDDDYFCWKVHKAGFRMAFVSDLIIPHHHRTTFKKVYGEEEVKKMQNNAMCLFENKTNAPRTESLPKSTSPVVKRKTIIKSGRIRRL